MGTQAIISLMKNGHTFIKILSGCDGQNSLKLAKIIRENKMSNIKEIYDLAVRTKFGCKDCLVVMNKDTIIYKGDEKLDPSYRETFDKPSFNPRWENGTADFVIILQMNNPEWT